MYNLGAVGFGHWFNRLYAGLRDSGEVKVAKIAGVSSIDGKLKKMREMGIGEDAYYQIGMDGPIPDRFYDGLDIVHISDPNEYHAEQTMDSLRHGKITITEKTWGINKKEFDDVARFVEDNDLGNKAYLHLHYLQKQLTKGLDALLDKYTGEYGKVKSVSDCLCSSSILFIVSRKLLPITPIIVAIQSYLLHLADMLKSAFYELHHRSRAKPLDKNVLTESPG